MAAWKKIGARYKDQPKNIFGLKIFLNPEDMSPVSTSIGTSGRLDLALTGLLEKVLKPGMNFVDVGANLGYYTLLAVKQVGRAGMVYAFEPESQNFEFLTRSIAVNNLGNVKPYQQALTDRRGAIKLFKASTSQPHEHSVTLDWGKGTEEVGSTTLDAFWELVGKPRLDMLKIHVVGDEPLVLKGASKVLRESRPKIAMVFVPPKWENETPLLESLLESYECFEVTQSPFLLRSIGRSAFGHGRTIEVFLTPRSVD